MGLRTVLAHTGPNLLVVILLFPGSVSGIPALTIVMGEGSYQVYPWLYASVRYEAAYPEYQATVTRLVPAITALYTANVKFILETLINPADESAMRMQAGMDFAF